MDKTMRLDCAVVIGNIINNVVSMKNVAMIRKEGLYFDR